MTGDVKKLFNSGYQNKEDNMGWACGTCGGQTNCAGGFDV